MKKIMKLFVAVSVICFMMASVTGCGKKNTENETGGKVVVNETKSTAETKKASETESVEPETKPAFEETKPDVSVSVPEELDSMRPILLGLCKTMAGGNPYDSSNSEFFWNSIYAAIRKTAGFIRISAFRMTAAAIRCRERLCRNMRKQCLPETARFLKFHRPSAVLNTLWTRTAI